MLVNQRLILPLDPKKYPIWLVVSTYPSEKYEFVSWDDDIPIRMESNKSHLPNHQPDIHDACFLSASEEANWLKKS